jgi:hypothetical protein
MLFPPDRRQVGASGDPRSGGFAVSLASPSMHCDLRGMWWHWGIYFFSFIQSEPWKYFLDGTEHLSCRRGKQQGVWSIDTGPITSYTWLNSQVWPIYVGPSPFFFFDGYWFFFLNDDGCLLYVTLTGSVRVLFRKLDVFLRLKNLFLNYVNIL